MSGSPVLSHLSGHSFPGGSSHTTLPSHPCPWAEWGRRATDARLPSLERLRVLAVPAIRQQVVFEGRRYDFAGAGAPTCTVGSSDGHPTLFIPGQGSSAPSLIMGAFFCTRTWGVQVGGCLCGCIGKQPETEPSSLVAGFGESEPATSED